MNPRLFLLAAIFPLVSLRAYPAELFRDTTQPIDKRVDDLISRLTLDEKGQLLNHRGTTVQRFNIRSDQWNQCLNGVKWDRRTTLFPSCVGMAATWDPALVQDVAGVLSDEARAIYNGWHIDPNAPGEHKGLIYRAPVINIERNPYWGRNHEAWGEDPYLTGRMGVAYVKGLNGDDPQHLKIAATLKHYAVNNVEADRKKLNAVVPEAMLRDYWFPHFRDAVVEGHAQSVMASYNAINGTPNNINHWLLTDVLKGDWGFSGFVVSDLGGVGTMMAGHEAGKMGVEDAVAQSLVAGCDFSDKEFEINIPAAVHDGKLTEARVDDALRRVLRVRFALGDFDPFEANPYSKIAPDSINSAAHRAVSRKAATESMVLLKNEGGLLPLDLKKIKSIAVIGPMAGRIITNSYNGRPDISVTPLGGIEEKAGQQHVQVTSALGSSVLSGSDVDVQNATDAAKKADVAILFLGTDGSVETEDRDRKSLALPGRQEALAEAVFAANPKTIVVEMSAGPLTVPWIAKNVPAIMQSWWPGEEGGHAIADVLFGDANPGGKLPHTVYASEEQVPPQSEYDISKGFTYMFVKGAPLFPFGHGLSYTTFAYSNLQVTPKEMPEHGSVKVSVDVENTGQRAGDEVTQLYIQDPESKTDRPSERLRGFQRTALQPGEKKTITMEVPAERLAWWDVKAHGFQVQTGDYQVLVGSSSADIRARNKLSVASGGSFPP